MVSESPDIKQSPSASKAAGKRQQRQKPQIPDEQGPQITVPKTSVGEWGVPSQVLFLLEVSSFSHYTWPQRHAKKPTRKQKSFQQCNRYSFLPSKDPTSPPTKPYKQSATPFNNKRKVKMATPLSSIPPCIKPHTTPSILISNCPTAANAHPA